MSVLPIETRLVTFLNVVLLMLVAIIPYLFDQVVSPFNASEVRRYASILFTIDFAATLLILAIFAHVIAIEEKQLVEKPVMARFRTSRNILFLLTAVVLLSLAFPWDWTYLGVPVRLFIWYVPIIMFWYNRMTRAPVGATGASSPA